MITIKRALMLAPSFQEGLNKLVNCPMSFKEGLRLAKMAAQMDNELKVLEKARNALIMKYGDKKDDGGYEVIDPVKMEKYQQELREVAVESFDTGLEEPIKIALSDVEKANIKMTPAEIHLLSALISVA